MDASDVAGWVVKGVRSWMDEAGWAAWMRVGKRGFWVTTKNVSPVRADMPVFLYKGSPDSMIVAEGRLTGEVGAGETGAGPMTRIGIEIVRVLPKPLKKEQLKKDRRLADASFLKVGPVGTFYRLEETHVAAIRELAQSASEPQRRTPR